MFRTDPRLERALLAVAIAAAVVLLLAVPDGEPVLSSDVLPIAVAVGVAVYAADGDCCDSCGCC